MRIKRVECDQFAGLTNREIELDQGLNLLIGDNESGKSTVVDLIYHLLFQDAKLDGRTDSGFIDKYFPKKADGPQRNVINGVLVFETPSGKYKLKKKWKKGDGECSMTLPDQTLIEGDSTINAILTEELKHRAGVYGEIVFASQKRNQTAVESIMKALGKKNDSLSETREALTSTLTRAALETGGVSIDKLEKALEKKLKDLIGRWDWAADAPEGGPNRASYKNKWEIGAGTIVKAYYEMDEVREKQQAAEDAERNMESIRIDIDRLQAKKTKAETELKSFLKSKGLIEQRNLLANAVEQLMDQLNEKKKALEAWPGYIRDLETAENLKKRQNQAHIHELYQKTEPLRREYQDQKNLLEKLTEVDPEDLNSLRKLVNEKQREESRLSGMNLVAKIRELGSAEIRVTSFASGKTLDPVNGEIQINEAVQVSIPGIMEMQLIPGGVDIEAVKQHLSEIGEGIAGICEKYGINSIGELQQMDTDYSSAKKAFADTELRMKIVLGDFSWDDLAAANETVSANIETEAEIRRQLESLCGIKPVDEFIGALGSKLSDYKDRYGSMEKLAESIEELKLKATDNREKLESLDEIPEEYQKISNPDEYEKELTGIIDEKGSLIKGYNDDLINANRNLGDQSAEEYSDELQEKENHLKALKTEYSRWKNIHDAFCRLKARIEGNPVEEIEKKFREYLELITDGKLNLKSMDSQMSVQLTSGSNALTYDILSDGTKDTVSLAFRLAMLEHLFRDGEGLAVFDDPFTDMDPRRVEQSCRLIQKFAENNQVIFITCDNKYRNYLSGNVVPMQIQN